MLWALERLGMDSGDFSDQHMSGVSTHDECDLACRAEADAVDPHACTTVGGKDGRLETPDSDVWVWNVSSAIKAGPRLAPVAQRQLGMYHVEPAIVGVTTRRHIPRTKKTCVHRCVDGTGPSWASDDQIACHNHRRTVDRDDAEVDRQGWPFALAKFVGLSHSTNGPGEITTDQPHPLRSADLAIDNREERSQVAIGRHDWIPWTQ